MTRLDGSVRNQLLQATSWEAETISAASATAALEQLKQTMTVGKPVDMAILDIHMPDIDGIMLSSAMKADPELRNIPLLALSSVDHESSGERTSSTNFFAWLRKPVRQSLLRECLVRQRYRVTETVSSTVPLKSGRSTFTGRILLAEDNPVNREVALGMLELFGCRVDLVENGHQAVEAVSKQHYDLVLMDCQMPVLDGYATTATIRAHEQERQLPRMPIIALTANAMEGDRERCLAAGMDDYLSKPFTQDGLQATLRRWMATKLPDAFSSPERSVDMMAQTTPLGIPVIDESAWNNLLALEQSGRTHVVQKTLSLYLSDSRRLLGDIRTAIQTGDAAALSTAAHQLKSASAQVGALAASIHAGHIERLADKQQLDAAANLVEPLEESVELSRRIFEDTIRPQAA